MEISLLGSNRVKKIVNILLWNPDVKNLALESKNDFQLKVE